TYAMCVFSRTKPSIIPIISISFSVKLRENI
ncbi:unnamed protein product, partial [marine sediment metagenome]